MEEWSRGKQIIYFLLNINLRISLVNKKFARFSHKKKKN